MSKLDLKYRPSKFRDVLGNDGVKKLLLKRSVNGTLGDQSMMFGGPKGCGKTSFARIVARAMLCSDLNDGEPCGECSTCTAISNDVSDSVEEMDAASQGTVDHIRSMVHDADYSTISGNDKYIYIIDEAQRLSKAAQDALLKSIENRLFIVILCTTEPNSIKGPIRDRVEEYPVSPPSSELLKFALEKICVSESIVMEPDALQVVIDVNKRTPRSCILSIDALSMIGGVTVKNVESYFRFEAFSSINKVLYTLDSDPSSSLAILDTISNCESPTWIRDAFVLAISSGFRSEIGVKSTFPVKTDFFNIRGRRWTNLALDLGRIDRPSMAAIEAILLSSYIITNSPESISINPTVKTKDESTEVKSSVDSSATEVKIDGVSFSRVESLTSLDYKITPNNKQRENTNEEVSVRLDDSRAPITEKEFVSEFVSRFKGSE